ncbi:MAG: HAD hydrolase-like protein, partial [Firmicutes bacterium]|nr:HAD hydrolase-like protein [Bacillota bacterium]
MSKYSWVFWDLDGTLTDPREGIVNSVAYALSKMGRDVPAPSILNAFIGPPLLESFTTLTQMNEAEAYEAIRLYRERFSTQGLYENALLPGIPDLLKALKEDGRKLAVATNKSTPFAHAILDHFHLTPYFSYISSVPLDQLTMTKKHVIDHALQFFHPDALDRVLMIGDHRHDICSARQCGIHSCAVLYGYGNHDELMACRPNFTAQTVNDLYA